MFGVAVHLRGGGAERTDRRQFGKFRQSFGERHRQTLEVTGTVRHEEVGGHGPLQLLLEGRLHRRGHHRHGADESESDHQRRSSGCGSTWCALGVATTETAGDRAGHRPEGKRKHSTDDATGRCGDGGGQAGDAEEEQHCADRRQSERSRRSARLSEHADAEQNQAESGRDRSDDETLVLLQRIETQFRAHGGHGRNARGAECRNDGGGHGDTDPDDRAGDDGSGGHDERGRGESRAGGVEDGHDALGHSHSRQNAEQRGHDRDHQRLADDHGANLPRAGADGTEKCQFAQTLADDDGEGVEDEEGAHEQRHGGETEKNVAEDVDDVVDRAGRLLGGLFSGDHFETIGECPIDGGHHRVAIDAFVDGHIDRIDHVLGAEELVGGFGIERRDAGATTVCGLAGAVQSDEREFALAGGSDNGDGVTHLVSGSPRRRLVEGHFVGSVRGPSLDHCATVEAVGSDPGDTESWAGSAQWFAVGFDDGGGPQQISLGQTNTVDGGDHRHQIDRHRIALGGGLVTEGDGGAHFEIDALAERGEEIVDGFLHAVGEYEGATDEGHSTHHRENGEEDAPLTGDDAPKCESGDGGGHVRNRDASCGRALGRPWDSATRRRSCRRRGRSRGRRTRRPPDRG